jgi:hypothetical protein
LSSSTSPAPAARSRSPRSHADLGLVERTTAGRLLRLPWSVYESPYIRLRQSKGGRRVATPAGAPLRTLLDATTRQGPLILTNTLGRPWTSDGSRASWGKGLRACRHRRPDVS